MYGSPLLRLGSERERVLKVFFSFSAAVAVPAVGEGRGKDEGTYGAAFFPEKLYVPET